METNIYVLIERLLQYGTKKQLISSMDVDFTRNAILEILELDEWQDADVTDEELDSPAEILEGILNWAWETGRLKENTVTSRDLLDTKIMGCFVSKPSEIARQFYDEYERLSPREATQNFYHMSQNVHYIRKDRIAKNEHWFESTEFGDLEITINLSKSEKDPKEIAAAKTVKKSAYPKCLLCKENVGYAGRLNHPARQNLRVIPLQLTNEDWFLQFSPYVYYEEHAIVFLGEHQPMKISKKTFDRLLEFVGKFPHYFLGSNADLPIVGGSILAHDHFQGGNHEFPMAKANIEVVYSFPKFPGVKAGIVKWPMSVIRLQGENRNELSNAADFILQSWKEYSDEQVGVYAYTEQTPHNTITPIARKRGNLFELDLVLRNNRTSEEHPLGIFHPHDEVHHIKKENIGLIEVMGLAILPGRLKDELFQLSKCLLKDQYEEEIKQNKDIVKHLHWAVHIKSKYPDLNPNNIEKTLLREIGLVFSKILEHAGVFKRDHQGQKAFKQFLASMGAKSSTYI
ncbi:UDP-glucose--hexose-1-phosphate uridylyltransferase [Bacillus sp. 03113]|uniref:UDP-glucose--hexose-1-phosphate uridylyltransferase n=1 Tax=Bacillus sp. 03113 TaxID=2578211 RepID=UPI0011427EAA|nr:UDP-glucose--hexose-1-phosphate uridylyltransferase [Bacillus sp. 03113]